MAFTLCLIGLVIMAASILFAIITNGKKPIVTRLIALTGQIVCAAGLILYF